MKNQEEIKEITQEDIDAWKIKYGAVYIIEVAEEPEISERNTVGPDLDTMPKLVGYLKKPDRKVMNFAMVTMARNILDAGKTVMKDCWLGGDRRLISDEKYNATAAFQAIELVDIYQSRLKKL